MVQSLWKAAWQFPQKVNRCHMSQDSSSWVRKQENDICPSDTCPQTSRIIHNCQNMQTTQCPLREERIHVVQPEEYYAAIKRNGVLTRALSLECKEAGTKPTKCTILQVGNAQSRQRWGHRT